MITYSHSKKVGLSWLGGRPLLSLPEGGRVALDCTLLKLWQAADGHSLDEILANNPGKDHSAESVRMAIACLAEAGLLIRDGWGETTGVTVVGYETNELSSLLGSTIRQGDETGKPGDVAAILVAYNSQAWLDGCLSALLAQTMPPDEIILVDNGSAENPADWLHAHYPSVQLLRLETPNGLAYALNRGIELAHGSYLLLINPDITLQPDALEQMLKVARHNPDCAAVAPKLRFSWAPAFLNGLGNYAAPFSWGMDIGLGHLDLEQFDTYDELPSACFAAALLSQAALQRIGALDEGFPMYYEDLEWCYRARLLGERILAAPLAVAYHALGQQTHTGTQAAITPDKLRNVTYGRLRFAKFLWRAPALWRSLGSYALADLALLTRALLRLNPAQALAVLHGWGRFLRYLPAIRIKQQNLRSRRVLNDSQILTLQHRILPPLIWRGLPELTWEGVNQVYLPLVQTRRCKPLPENAATRPRLLIISHDIVAQKMAGPGIRYLEMAKALQRDLQVTLAIPNETSLDIPGLTLAPYGFDQTASLRSLAMSCDVLLLSSFILDKFPFLADLPVRRVVDLYDPLVLENLHLYQNEPIRQQSSLNSRAIEMMNRLVKLGDFFICGNERQRDFWLGVLAANGRLNPLNFAQDDSLRGVIDVVGVGFPERPPRSRPLLRGVHPAFPPASQIILWGGGIWDWLDPLTLLKAWPAVLERFPMARLVFLGTRHPNPLVPPHAMAAQVESLAADLGEKDRTIFFFDWLSYEDREAMLCEADVGVVLHPVHLETRYSIRTRVLDYLWAGLPVLVTQGDVTSEWVADGSLGRTVPPHDPAAVRLALEELLSQPKTTWAPAMAILCEKFTWSQVVEPLRWYCLEGAPAPDRETGGITRTGAGHSWHSNLARASYILRHEGLGTLLHRIRRYLQWKLSRY